MSLHQLATHMSAQGRGPDSALVHMSPRELSGLQSLAMAHGGTLTINPETGLPEAGFLDSILPTLLGGAATFFSGGAITPFMAALGVGGLTALTSKDLGKGLMAGLGAYGGAGIMQGLAGFGAADIGEKAISSAAADATAAGLTNESIMTDTSGVLSNPYATAMQKGVADRMAGASYSDRLKAGALKAMSNPGDAFNAIGGGSMFKGAAMLGAPLLSAISSQDQTSVPTVEQIKFDPRYANINISRQQRPYQPDTGSSGERRYFGDTYVTQYADGGAVANDGIERFADGGGTVDAQVIVYGPDGKLYSSPAAARAAGVTNYTLQPPAAYGGGTAAQQQAAIDKIIAERKVLAAATSAAYQRDYPAEFAADPVQKNAARIAAEAANTTGSGGGTIDPTYDYSGYGDRSKSSGMRPIAYTEAPKPDFVAADGKTYRYDPVKKIWYVVKEADAKTNAGVETLMGGSDRDGNGGSPYDPGPGGGYGFPGATMVDGISGKTTGIASGANSLAAFLGNLGLTSISDAIAKNVDPNFSHEGRAGRGASDVNPLGGDVTSTPAGVDNPMGGDVTSTPAGVDNPMGGDVTSSTPDGPSGAPPGGGDVAEGGGGGGPADGGDGTGDGRAHGGYIGRYAQGGLGSLGGYSDGGRLLRGPGDGVSDSIPATVGNRQPARLADGEFVVPARIVSELGNGSTEAGARALYKMMDRIQANRRKTTGKNRVAVNSKSHKYLPA